MLDRGFDNAEGGAIGASDQFDNNVDVGIGRHRCGVVKPARGGDVDASITASIARRHGGEHQTASAARGEEVAVLLQ